MDLTTRAKEIAEFLGVSIDVAEERLSRGFHANHALVAEDFIGAGVDVNSPSQLLNWYRTTDAYIWELSAYHLEPGFNYMGMCEGYATHLLNAGKSTVMCLGDGIGDLSMHLRSRGLDPTYHDLADSKTALFAQEIARKNNLVSQLYLSHNWVPPRPSTQYDAVIALDFFEHLVNVEEYVRAVHDLLKTEGLFSAQNAFACGDAEHGNSIPMHLSINNHWAEDWDGLLESVGFELIPNSGGWWFKK